MMCVWTIPGILPKSKPKEYSANLIAAHLDAMNATDKEPWQNKARYTCTVTNEVLFFLEKYSQRHTELVNHIREGRIMLSPFLVNTDWGYTGGRRFFTQYVPGQTFCNSQ